MNFRDLTYLIALDDYQHFGRAAESCFVSQPALSMQIKKLEEELGVPLIERKAKSFIFTDTGREVLEQARRVVDQMKVIKTIAENAKDPESGPFRLGIIPTLGPYLLPTIMPLLTKRFPRIQFYLLEDQTERLLKKLNSGELHAAICALPNHEPMLHEEILFA